MNPELIEKSLLSLCDPNLGKKIENQALAEEIRNLALAALRKLESPPNQADLTDGEFAVYLNPQEELRVIKFLPFLQNSRAQETLVLVFTNGRGLPQVDFQVFPQFLPDSFNQPVSFGQEE